MKFNFNYDYYLENDFVILEPLQKSHFNDLLKFSVNEPELWTYSLIKADSKLNLKNYLNLALKGRESQKEYPFIIYDKRNKCYAGSTRFYDIQIENSNLQLGYTWYGKQFQRTGVNRHCKFLLLDFAFKILNVQRVEFRADNENKKSIDAMKNIGCTKEGVLRSNSPKPDGSRRDSIVLSILKHEWNRTIRETLKQKCRF
jgi:RimJ/RimL family protein N-acetyltransferase